MVAASVASPGGSGPAVPDREVPMPVRLRRQLSAAHFAGVLRRASAAGQQQALTRTRSCTGVPAPPSSPASVGGQQSESASGCGLQPSLSTLSSPLAAQHCTAAPPAHTLRNGMPAGFSQGQQPTLGVTHSDAECSLHHLPLPDLLLGDGGAVATLTTSATASQPGDAPTTQGAAWSGGGGDGSAASLGPPIRAAAAPQLSTCAPAGMMAAATHGSGAANTNAEKLQTAASNQTPGTLGAGAGSGSGSGSRRGGTRTQAAAGRGVRPVAGAGTESGRGGVGVGLKRTASMKAVSAAAHKRRAAEAAASQQPKQEQREQQQTASAAAPHSLQQQFAQQCPMPALPEEQQQQQQKQAATSAQPAFQAASLKEPSMPPDVAALTMQMEWNAAGSRPVADEPGAEAGGAAPPGRAADDAGLGWTAVEAAARLTAAGAGQHLQQQQQQGLEERTGCVPRGAEGEDEAQMLLRKEKNRQAARWGMACVPGTLLQF